MSPRRLISLLVFASYYVFVFVRPFERPSRVPSDFRMQFEFPPLAVLDAIVFGGFALASLMLAIGAFGPKGGFRPADVDVLFPTPISPKVVLLFRLVRDYLLTLLVPLAIILIGWRPARMGLEVFFRNFPEYGAHVFRAAAVAWLLLALSWICIGYAASLFVNRSDLVSDRNKRVIAVGIAALFLAVGVFVALALREEFSWTTLYGLSQSPFLRVVFFTATAATALVMAPLEGSAVSLLLGLGGLALIIFAALRVAFTQVDWMYDQAAARGFATANARELHRKGDMYGLLAEQARRGKLRPGRLARRIARTNANGAGALVWKEALLNARGGLLQVWILFPIVLFMVGILAYGMADQPVRLAGAAFAFANGIGVFLLVIATATTGFVELLRRVDLQKPLPFSPAVTVGAEVVAKVVPLLPILLGAAILGVALDPRLWPHAIASLIAMPALGVLLSAVVLLTTVLFPDIDDPTQRGFRGLMTLLGLAILALPSAGLAVGLYILGVHPILVSIPSVLINAALAAGVSLVAGSLYGAYNPSE
jgi:hypothetical protein